MMFELPTNGTSKVQPAVFNPNIVGKNTERRLDAPPPGQIIPHFVVSIHLITAETKVMT